LRPWKFSSDVIVPQHSVALGSIQLLNKSDNQGIFLGIKCGRHVELTILPS
jgi:hypothetical protein